MWIRCGDGTLINLAFVMVITKVATRTVWDEERQDEAGTYWHINARDEHGRTQTIIGTDSEDEADMHMKQLSGKLVGLGGMLDFYPAETTRHKARKEG